MPTVTALKPTCPYCGHEVVDDSELDFGPGLIGDTVVMCGICDQNTLCVGASLSPITAFEPKEDL